MAVSAIVGVQMRGFLVDPDGSYETSWQGIVAALCAGERSATVERKTRETTIRARELAEEYAQGEAIFEAEALLGEIGSWRATGWSIAGLFQRMVSALHSQDH